MMAIIINNTTIISVITIEIAAPISEYIKTKGKIIIKLVNAAIITILAKILLYPCVSNTCVPKILLIPVRNIVRSEERRVGKEC